MPGKSCLLDVFGRMRMGHIANVQPANVEALAPRALLVPTCLYRSLILYLGYILLTFGQRHKLIIEPMAIL